MAIFCFWFQIRHRCTLEGLSAFKLVSRDARGLSDSSSSILGPYLMSFDTSVLICGNLCLWFQIRHRCTLEGLSSFKLVSRDARGLSDSSSSILGPYLMSFDPSVLICGNLYIWFQIRHRCTLEGLYAFKLVSRDARGLSDSSSSILGPYLMSFDTSVLICGNMCLWFQIRHRCTLGGLYAFKLVSRDARGLSESSSSIFGPYSIILNPSVLIYGNFENFLSWVGMDSGVWLTPGWGQTPGRGLTPGRRQTLG